MSLRFVLIVLVFLVISLPVSGAEIGTRDALEERLFLIRQHFLRDDAPAADGIRSINVNNGAETKHRQLFTNCSSADIHNHRGAPDGLELSFMGDRLFLQNWPYSISFDIFSWKMINRLPTPESDGARGWILQGPMLSEPEAERANIPPGTYGIARCVRQEVSFWGHYGEPCTQLTLTSGLQLNDTAERVLLFADDVPSNLGKATIVAQFSDSPRPVNEYSVLSFDPDRTGLWRGTQQGAVFHPFINGQLMEPTVEIDFMDIPEFAAGNSLIEDVVYNQSDQRLFATSVASDLSATLFFAFDPVTGSSQVYPQFSPVTTANVPATLAALGTAPRMYRQMLPIIAETAGENGTFWTTDLWVFNPANEPVTVRLWRLSNPESSQRTLELGARQSRRITNVLEYFGGGHAGDGTVHDALYVESPSRWGEQLAIVGRMWTPDNLTSGSYGHAVPAVPAPYGYSNHQPYLLDDEEHWSLLAGRSPSFITLDLREQNRFRHNLGVVNVHDHSIQIDLHWSYHDVLNDWDGDNFGYSPPPETKASFNAPAKSVTIVDVKSLFPSSITDHWPPRIAIAAGTPTPVWFSMLDNQTGDATFVPFTNFTYTFPLDWDYDAGYGEQLLRPYRFMLPVATHSKGVGTSYWKTDLYGFGGNGLWGNDVPNVAIYPQNRAIACGGEGIHGSYVQRLFGEMGIPLERWVQVVPFPHFIDSLEHADGWWRTIVSDVVRHFSRCDEDEDVHGGLGILNGSWFSGFSRTYTTRDDGGTYGGMLPLYPPHGWPVQHFAGIEIGAHQRVNLGLFNGDYDATMEYHLTLYSANGEVAAETELILDSLESYQKRLEHVFGVAVGRLPSGNYGLTVQPINHAQPDAARSWAYVSVVDNGTNDPINIW